MGRADRGTEPGARRAARAAARRAPYVIEPSTGTESEATTPPARSPKPPADDVAAASAPADPAASEDACAGVSDQDAEPTGGKADNGSGNANGFKNENTLAPPGTKNRTVWNRSSDDW